MALDPPQGIFSESDASDCGSMVVEPPTSPRAPSPEPNPPPAPRSSTPDAGPGPAAKTPDRDSDKAVYEGSAPGSEALDRDSDQGNKSSGKASDQGVETRTNMPLEAPVFNEQSRPTMPESPGHPFLSDFAIPYLTASPGAITPTHSRPWDDFEADLNAAFDPALSLGIRGAIEESEGLLYPSFSLEGNVEAGAVASAVPETDCPEDADGEEEGGHEARSLEERPGKRRRV